MVDKIKNIVKDDCIIKYNKKTYNIDKGDNEIKVKIITLKKTEYEYSSKNSKYKIHFSYGTLIITMKIQKTEEVLLLYIILQYHFNIDTIKDLRNKENGKKWDYNLWEISITSLNDKKLPDHLILLNYFLNLKDKFNTIIPMETLKKEELKLQGRGLWGERARELYSKFGTLNLDFRFIH